jgi:hypothetical protein
MVKFLRLPLRRLFFVAAALAVVSGCGGGGSGTALAPAPQATPAVTSNEHQIYVDAGPANTGYNANRLYTDVTICQPGNAINCQTIPHVLVDTGSTGLRILADVLNPALGLPVANAPGGRPLLGCVRFVDNTFAWGPVAQADINLGAKRAINLPIQLIADSRYNHLASNCDTGTNITGPDVLGANGVLGIGLFLQDCGAACETTASNSFYFTCTNFSCLSARGTALARNQQLQNPVSFFASDNNGVAIELPAVGTSPTAKVVGKMVFGIGTRSNNQPLISRVVSADSLGYVTTVFDGRVMARSFIDSGSNGLYFDTAKLPVCAGANVSGFYCPASLTTLSATISGDNAVALPVSFNVDNAVDSFAGTNPVLPNLSGTFADSRTFDWGLPFFYGRKVYFGFDGMASSVGTGPFYAF